MSDDKPPTIKQPQPVVEDLGWIFYTHYDGDICAYSFHSKAGAEEFMKRGHLKMPIDSPPGTKVVYRSPDWTLSGEKGGDLLTVGQVYTVARTEIHTWHTRVYLEEVPGHGFGSTQFSLAPNEGDEA